MLWVMSGPFGKVLANYVLGRLEGQRRPARIALATAAGLFWGRPWSRRRARPCPTYGVERLQVIAQAYCATKLAWAETFDSGPSAILKGFPASADNAAGPESRPSGAGICAFRRVHVAAYQGLRRDLKNSPSFDSHSTTTPQACAVDIDTNRPETPVHVGTQSGNRRGRRKRATCFRSTRAGGNYHPTGARSSGLQSAARKHQDAGLPTGTHLLALRRNGGRRGVVACEDHQIGTPHSNSRCGGRCRQV